MISKAADELRGETFDAIKAAGLDPRVILTRRQLETRLELELYSGEEYAAGLAKLEGPPSEYQKMWMRAEESGDADMEASRAEGASECALCETSSMTRAGALRLLRHLADFLDEDDVINDLYLGDVDATLLNCIVRDMAERGRVGGLEFGFLNCVNEYAMFAASTVASVEARR